MFANSKLSLYPLPPQKSGGAIGRHAVKDVEPMAWYHAISPVLVVNYEHRRTVSPR